MIRSCDGTDPDLVNGDGEPCDCGLIFDDVECMVIYPHTAILGRAEKDALWDKVQASIGVPYVWGTASPTERVELEP
jgi:hypothetical protein